PCALTATVRVSSRTSSPSRVLACTTTGTCSITRSLRRRFAGLGAVTLLVSTMGPTNIPHAAACDERARKARAISLLAEPGFQPRFCFRPFGVDDAEIHGVPNAAGCGHHVISKDAFLGGANAQNCGAGSLIQRIGFQLHAHAFERFEGVTQQQVFGL